MDFNALMKQAQKVQQQFEAAQARMNDTTVVGEAGAGLVKVELKGIGEMLSLSIDDSLMAPGEGEVLADLIRAAHTDARKKLETVNADLMKEAAGPLGAMGGLPNMPKFFQG
jgi:nucleoid-associated protein EbfC